MICPKCGFDQPDDLYCALCGVHVEKYTQRKRKKLLKISLLAIFLGVGAVATGNYFFGFLQSPSTPSSDSTAGRIVAPLARPGPDSREMDFQTRVSNRSQRRAKQTDFGASNVPSQEGDENTSQSGENRTGVKLTPQNWLQKGIALDDDSDAEIEHYQHAIQLDPTFAPAYFRLGAIYYRQARYDLADEQFAEFLKHATDEDRRAYDIYLYISLSDEDRLLEAQAEETTGTGEESETSEEETEESPGEEGEQATEAVEEEVHTIVHFSPSNGHITVPVVLNEELTTNMLVDTGAGITVLSKDLADELGLEFERGHAITLKTMAMDVQAQVAKLDAIRVGDFRKTSHLVAVADLPIGESGGFRAILGMDFLNNYTIQIDNKNNTLTLTSKTP